MPAFMNVFVCSLKKILWICLYLTAMGGGRLLAGQSVHGLDNEKVHISLEAQLLSKLPDRGTVTLKFEVRNLMRSPGRWTFHFASTRGWNNRRELICEREITVDANSVKTVSWEIPVFPGSEFHSGETSNLNLTVQGPGASGSDQRLLFNNTNSYGRTDPPLLVISPELRITRDNWDYAKLTKLLDDRNADFYLASFDPVAMPSSVSGFSGVDLLLMTRKEWDDFAAEQAMFKRWIVGGGKIFLVTDAPKMNEQIGVGLLQEIPYMSPEDLIKRLKQSKNASQTFSDADAFYRRNWELADEVPEIKQSFGWVMLAVIGIAVLLGPLNIWISLRKRNAMQVIWTTPLISLVLSVLVALGIVFSDGFGGKGSRALYILLDPSQGVEVLVQEQISRTGVLLKNRFSLPEGTELYAAPTDRSRQGRKLVYTQLADGGWAGDWFENRNIQTQVLRRNRSSRAKMIFKAGSVPSVLSTVDAGFSRILIRDDRGKLWMADHVAPGKEQVLRRAESKEVAALFEDLKTRDHSLFPGDEALNRKGWFYAETPETDRYLDTLPSIKWQNRPVWYMGPVKMKGQP